MANKKMKIDFFKVEMPRRCNVKCEAIFDALRQTALDGKRNERFGGAPIRLHEGGNIRGDFCEGNMLRLQMDGWPSDAGIDGTKDDLQLDDDHGLGHETAFLYYAPLCVLAMQRNRGGVNAVAMARYIEAKAKLSEPVVLTPIERPKAIEELTKKKRIRKIGYRVASMSNASTKVTDEIAVTSALSIMESVSAPGATPYIEVKIAIDGPRQLSIKPSRVMQIVRGLIGISSEARIEKIDISCSNTSDEKLELLHILDFCVTAEKSLRVEQNGIPYHRRSQALKDAFKEQKALLVSILG